MIMAVATGVSTAQPEVMAWGNITGIRVEGQLMNFETSLRVVQKGWKSYTSTGMEKQRPKFSLTGETRTVSTSIGSLNFSESINDTGKGAADVSVKVTATSDTLIEGAYFCLTLPEYLYSEARVSLNTGASGSSTITGGFKSVSREVSANKVCSGFTIEGINRKLEVRLKTPSMIWFRRDPLKGDPEIYISLTGNKLKRGQEFGKSITLQVSGDIDTTPAEFVIDAEHPGRRFDGFGGNFRLQNPATDPQVIQYCLENMRLSWGRVEMPWYSWQPDENNDPIEEAKAGKLNPHVTASLEMAVKLASKGIHVIVSAWGAPKWAIIGDPMDAFKNRSKGIYGYQLNPAKTDLIYKSIASYIFWLKEKYGVEASMFSFNESDLGINVRHTGKEHDEFIKGLGAKLATLDLSTKLLLGDNSDATTFDFIIPALNDPDAYRYIGAISFHSWRGCTDENLNKWASASKQLNLPLIVGEGSTDAAAWNYPQIFSEESFAMNEINLYTRLCAICQPVSILQWQLTTDYSILSGAGIFGTTGPLKPTQRFWNLKQLSDTPAGAFALPVTCSNKEINCAAFGNRSTGEMAIHIVNNGACRMVTLKGIPEGISILEIYQTDRIKCMEKTGEVRVENGCAGFALDKNCFTSLICKKK